MSTSKNSNKIAAIIPFFNERGTINQIIQLTLKHVDAVIAVNDGSTDNSSENITLGENIILLSIRTVNIRSLNTYMD